MMAAGFCLVSVPVPTVVRKDANVEPLHEVERLGFALRGVGGIRQDQRAHGRRIGIVSQIDLYGHWT